ncbi:hypothetical protein [Dyella sp.]|uniref:hypothetical protein n=1 Tax=Dyella sp. TaxID=1869338 RepID=UPI002B49775E|nr:hypothetical protein [Dyella sp.]HKT29183.1 hypothetical protein [Dyella sp.]
MSLSDRALSRLQAWSTICAAVVVPLVIAFFGWQIKSRLSSNSLKKDYVSMAITILAAPDNKENKALRVWAIQILEQNSPIPFTPAVRNSFLQGKFVILSPIPQNLLSSPLMQAPKPWKPLARKGVVTNRDLLMNYLDNMGIFQENSITLKYLQQAIRDMATPGKPSETGSQPSSRPAHQSTSSAPSTPATSEPSAGTAVH